MQMFHAVVLAALITAPPLGAQQAATPPPQPPAPGGAPGADQRPTPGADQGAQPGAAVPQPAPSSPPVSRAFTAPIGMWFHTVRPDRAGDFEEVIAHLQQALARTTNGRVRQQAFGWHMLKASEPGPNGTVLYVFVMDPAIPGADYSLGRILAEAYADTPQLQEIWKLYTGSVTGGGSLLNLSPLAPTLRPGAPPPVDSTPEPPPAAPGVPRSEP